MFLVSDFKDHVFYTEYLRWLLLSLRVKAKSQKREVKW